MASNGESVEKRVFDVNVLAIYLVSGHPGFESVVPVVEEGLRGAYIPLIMDILPMRAFWIMTRRWGLEEKECRVSVENFLESYETPHYVGLTKETIVRAFQLAEDLKHDVFDCMYLGLAMQERAACIVTTDTDFEKLCNRVGLQYLNPVPPKVLKRFNEQNR